MGNIIYNFCFNTSNTDEIITGRIEPQLVEDKDNVFTLLVDREKINKLFECRHYLYVRTSENKYIKIGFSYFKETCPLSLTQLSINTENHLHVVQFKNEIYVKSNSAGGVSQHFIKVGKSFLNL